MKDNLGTWTMLDLLTIEEVLKKEIMDMTKPEFRMYVKELDRIIAETPKQPVDRTKGPECSKCGEHDIYGTYYTQNGQKYFECLRHEIRIPMEI